MLNLNHKHLIAFDDVYDFDIDPIGRRVVVYGRASRIHDLGSNDSVAIRPATEHFYDIRFGSHGVLALSKSSVWRLDPDERAWTVAYGLPAGARAALAPSANSVVYHDPKRSQVFSRDLDSHKEEPLPLKDAALKFMSASADGKQIAVSTGRDFRSLARPKKRASWFKHKKMFLRGLLVSPDGQYATAWGLLPDSLKNSPPDTFVWHLPTRKLLQVVKSALPVGFVGEGESTLVALRHEHRLAHERIVSLRPPAGPSPVDSIPKLDVVEVRGSGTLMGYLTRSQRLVVVART